MPQYPTPTLALTKNETPEALQVAAGVSHGATRAARYRLPRSLTRRVSSDGKTSLAEWVFSVKSYALLRLRIGVICVLCQLADPGQAPVAQPASTSLATGGPCAGQYPGNRPLLYQSADSRLNRPPREPRNTALPRTTTLWRCDREATRAGSAPPIADGSGQRTARTRNHRQQPARALASRRALAARARPAPSDAPRRWDRATVETGRPAPAWSAPGAPTNCATLEAISCSSLSANRRASSDGARAFATFCTEVRS